MDALDALQDRIGYRFADRAWLERALTHSSYANENAGIADNQRLEFLGDAVLDLVVAEILIDRLPEALEGELTRLRARLVSEPSLVRAAESIGVGDAVLLGRGEERSGGREKASIVGDACEALFGAVYLDGGIAAARAVVARVLGEAIDEALRGDPLGADHKSRLQERVQGMGMAAPRYRVVASEGPDHARVFEVAVEVRGQEARGRGRSKQEAEQEAARLLLEMIL